MHNTGMPVSITIRDVPDEVRNELAARAGARGQSLQSYLLDELVRLAHKPELAQWAQRVQARKSVTGTRLSSEQILEFREAGRQ